MNNERRKKLSKTLSYHLRHAPEEIGLELEPGGWVLAADLLSALYDEKNVNISTNDLNYIVDNCEKQRFSFDESGTKIRCNQGHSVKVDLQLTETEPPEILFHGSGKKSLVGIMTNGLEKMSRHHVHLSVDEATAENVGRRHGIPVLFIVEAKKMYKDGHKFYVSDNGVWLVDKVPAKYLGVRRMGD